MMWSRIKKLTEGSWIYVGRHTDRSSC